MAFEGSTSIRVSSRNFFQGGIISFSTPIDLASATAESSNMLQLVLQAPDETVTLGGGAAGGGRGGRGGLGGLGGGGGLAGGGEEVASSIDAGLSTVRCIITTSDGKKSEVFFDLTSALPDNKGWMRVGVPLVAIRGFSSSNKQITSLAFSGDTIGSFYLGSIHILNDTTPIWGEPNVRELNLAFGDEFVFFASASAGATSLRYTWDFDSSDGVDIDSEGRVVRRTFRVSGDFIVTLTIHDAYGLKEPYSTIILVTVNP
ncbi:MAG: hypothetical protein IH944_06395 [Armatimonadetes bacterium]|nr:hypothetical protein [Armatimonadota bacterium]